MKATRPRAGTAGLAGVTSGRRLRMAESRVGGASRIRGRSRAEGWRLWEASVLLMAARAHLGAGLLTEATRALRESQAVAKAAGAADWNTVLRQELLEPLGMKDSSCTAAAISAASNHAEGYRWTPEGTVAAPFALVVVEA